MKLHANAALSWTGRRRLCELVVDEGLTIVAAAAASAGVVESARTTRRSAVTPPALIARRSAGSSSTSPSTTTRGSPTPRYSATKEQQRSSPSSLEPRPSTGGTGSGSNACSPTMAAATDQRSTRSPAAPSASATCAPAPTDRKPTAKQNASSAPLLNGWAYGSIYRTSAERTAALDGWLWHYNHRRRHAALGHQPPITRTNLLGSYS